MTFADNLVCSGVLHISSFYASLRWCNLLGSFLWSFPKLFFCPFHHGGSLYVLRRKNKESCSTLKELWLMKPFQKWMQFFSQWFCKKEGPLFSRPHICSACKKTMLPFSMSLQWGFFFLQKVDVNGDEPKRVDGITVTLRDVNLFTTGLFGCEASAEESFHTALVRRQMTVLGERESIYLKSYCYI